MIIEQDIIYRNKRVTFEQLKRSSQIPIKCECDKCHRIFITNKFRITRNHHQLCQACAIREKEKKRVPIGYVCGNLTKIADSDREDYSVCRCTCGNIKEIKDLYLIHHDVISCGCVQKEMASRIFTALSHSRTGDKHPRWKGGVTDKRKADMSTEKYKRWRHDVFARDNYTCQCCHMKSGTLNAHHIVPYHIDNDIATDLNNGITMCEKCHREFHHEYGMNCDRDDLTEFINEHKND